MARSIERNQILDVENFDELISNQFRGDINAMCWHREIKGDFQEIVSKIDMSQENIVVIHPRDLSELNLSIEGQKAREVLLCDLKMLSDYGADPVLNVIKSYDRDESLDFFPTDVYSYHVDRSPIATDTFLCTYYGAASDIIPNDQTIQKVKIPEIREKLRLLYDEEEGDFETFLKENYFDMHYEAKPDSSPINLGIGHMWKIATDHPESKVLPCIHRAPKEKEGEYRLLLIC